MLPALLALQVVLVLLLLWVLLRRPASDARLEALLRADLPGALARGDARGDALERMLRGDMGALREEVGASAARLQSHNGQAAEALRSDLLDGLDRIGDLLQGSLEGARGAHRNDAADLRTAVEAQLLSLQQRLHAFATDHTQRQVDGHEMLHTRLAELRREHGEHQDRLRGSVEQRLQALTDTNAGKLEEMRATVDEKLHATLESRLTASFGTVADHLTRVHNGLGEMSRLSAGVEDLSRIFTNVKSRGGFAEVQLGMLLEQMLAPAQFSRNAKVKPGTGEMVEYVVRLPTPQGEVLLPIDAKFPREAWERLESADTGSSEERLAAGRAFEAAIRTEARRISSKYIAPPATTSFALMFLPTEGLYAEVMRRDGLQAEIQTGCHVTIAGPSTLSAILSSFQMGFHMLDLKQKGDEVWKVLAGARREFGTFETLMGRMEKQVGSVQNTITDLHVRTRAINRSLRDVQVESQAGLDGTTAVSLPEPVVDEGQR